MNQTNTAKLTKDKDKSFTIEVQIDLEDIKKHHQLVLQKAGESVKIKGFRPGKAPLDLVADELSPAKILDQVAQDLIPEVYTQVIKDNNLKPIIDPKITVKNPPLTLEKDWQLEIKSAELPIVTLKEYQPQVKKINAAPQSQPTDDHDHDHHAHQIFDVLLESTTVELPPIVLESELEKRLSRLVDQTQQAGLTVDQYLHSQKTNLEDFKKKLATDITQEWTLNLALDQIAADEKITVESAEIDAEVKKYREGTVDTYLMAYLMRQQKTIDFLKNLK